MVKVPAYTSGTYADARYVMECAAPGDLWGKPSGFRPNREAQLIKLGILTPCAKGFVVRHVALPR